MNSMDYFRTLMMGACVGLVMPDVYHHGFEEKLTPEEERELKKLKAEKAKERLKQRGVKEWDIEGYKVWAINKKNAIRKVEKLKKIFVV